MRVFVGYDKREDVAYQVCKYSILKHSPTSKVYPIVQDTLRANMDYTREKDVLAATDFSLTRFLVPYLSEHDGFSVYCDCDFLFTQNIDNILNDINVEKVLDYAIWVVKHDYTPKSTTKMDSRKQIVYPRKNWASFVLFNNHHPSCRKLTREFVNTVTIPQLNELGWADPHIGSLDKKWNFLVGEYRAPDLNVEVLTTPIASTPAAIHYTKGGVWLGNDSCPSNDYAALWLQYFNEYKETLV